MQLVATKTTNLRRFLREMAIEREAVGARIAEARQAAGLSQPELAELLQTHRNTVSNWERGVTSPWREIEDIARVLNRPSEWILYGDGLVPTGGDANLRDLIRQEIAAENAALVAEMRRLTDAIETLTTQLSDPQP